MGGVVDGGVGIGIKTSPCRAAIEKAQAELRQEYDVREERRRELEFLEKGGNPLDFKFGNVASLSLQSTSIADRHPEQFQSSEAKGSFALAASPHGDSVESSGRPGTTSVSGRKSTENPVLFDGENELLEGEKKSMQVGRKNNKNKITSSEQSSQMDGNRNTKESEDSAIFRPYARRNRTRTNRDGARLGSADGVHNRGGQGSSLASRASIRDAKGSSTETNSQKEKPKFVGINGDVVSRTATPESRLDGQMDGEQALISTTSLKQSGLPADSIDIIAKGSKENNRHKQPVGNGKTPDLACPGPDIVFGGDGAVSVGADDSPVSTKEREIDSSGQLNGSSDLQRGNKTIGNEVDQSSEAFYRKSSDSSIHPSLGTDEKKDNVCNDELKISSNENTEALLSESENNKKLTGGEMLEREDDKIVQNHIIANHENHSAQQKEAGNDAVSKGEEETNSRSDQLTKAKDTSDAVKEEHEGQMGTENERKEMNNDHKSKINRDSSCDVRPPLDLSSCEVPSTSLSGMKPDAPPDCQTSGNNLSMTDNTYEDSVLEEARIIQAKHKRIAELSGRTSPLENRQRCHWNFVLEEMAWLANDVAQERIWKMTAAAQLCHRIASLSRYRCEEQSQRGKLKLVAHNLAKAVMQFWHSAEVILNGDNPNLGLEAGQTESVGSQRRNRLEASGRKNKDSNMESSNKSMLQTPGKSRKLPIQAYAVQYLRDSSPHVQKSQPTAPKTPDIASDVDMPEVSWDDHLTEESLFYTIPAGAIETYRRSIEVYVTECERTGSNVQEEVGTSIFSTVADQGYRDNAYDEDEAETSAYYLTGALEGSKSSKFAQKKWKNPRLYEQGADLSYGHYTSGTQPSTSLEKKPANLSIGPIPAKRMRTANASRQRVLGPFGTGAHGNVQAQAKTEVSSGDTNSFHDDQSSLHGGSRIQKGIEVESAGEFEKHVSYDYAETSTKPKKKKPKHLDSTFEPGWQLGSSTLSEQRDQSKKRLEHFESNGTSGLHTQHNAKKPKMMKQSLDNSYDNIMLISGSIPCPMASQMSNMSNQNKLMRYTGGRDRSRKAKALKASSLHSGPGSPWSLFEDQALVVLVHDMGPNWELVSYAINSTLQFKCIFRKPNECKERHKFLMDKSAGDGADSAEDSGSSQSYPYTLQGIPKGSARQLFQRLQGPVEEDTLKEHFDRIIYITQRQHHRTIQLKNESLDLKQIPVHNSHYVALSQVCPNNLNGVVLTPLDLVEATVSSPEVLPLSFQGSHASNLAMQNQGSSVSSVLAASGMNSPVPGSPGFVLGNNMPPAGPLNAPMRDGRYNVPKPSPSPEDEPQRMQPYNQMLSTRPIAQSNLSIPGAVPGSDRGVRVLPGGNGHGMNWATMPMARPGFPGMASSPMLNSNNIISSSMVGAQSPANMHVGPGATTQGRPRESMHLARGGHNTEQQRQMPTQELPMHVTQGSAQGVPAFNGIGPVFSNQTTPPVQTYPGHSQQQQHQMSQQQPHAPNNPHHHPQLQGANHGTSSQQQQMYLRIAKERQLQKRYLQQQQFAASNNLIPHVQSPPQLPMSSPLQNSPQVQSQSPSQSASLPPLTPSSPMTPMASQQHQPKNQLAPHSHGFPRNPQTTVGGLSNLAGPKQRQRQAQQQQFQQSGRAHPQQRQQAQSHQQQANFLKGIERGNMLVHQKLQADPSHLNGLSAAPGSMGTEKEMVQQGQGLYSGTGINQVHPSKAPIPQAPHHSQVPSGPAAPHSKQHLQQQMASNSENSAQGQFSAIPPGHNTSSALHQTVPSTLMNTHMGQLQSQPQQNQVTQAQTVAQRMNPQNRQHMNYDQLQLKSQPEKAQAADQKLVNAMSPQAGIGAATSAAMSAVDSAGKVARAASPVPQRKASEAGVTSIPAQNGAIGSKTLPGSVRGEQLQSLGQGGAGQRNSADNLPHHGHTGGGAHGALAKQSSGPLPSSSQQHYLPQSQEQREQTATQQQAQPQPPQTQHLQATKGSLFIGPTNS